MLSTISSQQNKVAVSLYLYHTDLWSEFKDLLYPLKDHINLYLGLCTEKDNKSIIDDLSDSDLGCTITFHQNYGADISPFLSHLSLIKEPLFIKLHSKKSYWGFKYHINWREVILNDLIKSKSHLINNIKILKKPDNGMLCNRSMLFHNREFTNSSNIRDLCEIMNINYEHVKNKSFVGGNMFMSKTEIFKTYLSPYMDNIQQLLSSETGKVCDMKKGTYCHGMERIFGYLVSLEGKKFCYPKHKTIKILNTDAPNDKYFSMVKTYNKHCYVAEDINLYGKILSSNSKEMVIEWYHMDKPVVQKYHKHGSNCISKSL